MDKSIEGALIPDEKAELDGYVNIANVLSVMHSRARVALRKSGSSPCSPLLVRESGTDPEGMGDGRATL